MHVRQKGSPPLCCCCFCVSGGWFAVDDKRQRRRRKLEAKRISLHATLLENAAGCDKKVSCLRGRTMILGGEVFEEFDCLASALLEAIDAAETKRYIGGKDVADAGDRAAEFLKALRFLSIRKPLDPNEAAMIEKRIEPVEEYAFLLVQKLVGIGVQSGWFLDVWRHKQPSFRELDAALVEGMNGLAYTLDNQICVQDADDLYSLERVAQAKLEREGILKSAAAEACARDVVFNYEMARLCGVSPAAVVAELDYSDVRGGLDAVFGMRTVDDEPALACYFAIASTPDLANRKPTKYYQLLQSVKSAFEDEAAELLVRSNFIIADDGDGFGDGIQSAQVFIFAAKGDGWDILDDHLIATKSSMRRCKLQAISADLVALKRVPTVAHRRPSLCILVLEYGARTAAQRIQQTADCVVWICTELNEYITRNLLAPLVGMVVSTIEPVKKTVELWSKKYHDLLISIAWGAFAGSSSMRTDPQLLFNKEGRSSVELRLRAYPKTNLYHFFEREQICIRCADEEQVHQAATKCRNFATKRRVLVCIVSIADDQKNIQTARAVAAEVCGLEASRPYFGVVWRVTQAEDIAEALEQNGDTLLLWFDNQPQNEILFQELRNLLGTYEKKNPKITVLLTESPLIYTTTGWEKYQVKLKHFEDDDDCEEDSTTVSSAFHTDALFIRTRDPNKTCADVADQIERETNKAKIVAAVYRNDDGFVVRICIRDLVQMQYLRANLLMGGNEYKTDLSRLATCFEFEKENSSEPTPAQRTALMYLPTEQVSIISAPAGAGKTWCAVRHVADTLIKSRSAQVLYVALSISLARLIMDRLAGLVAQKNYLSRFSLLLAGQNDGGFHVVNGLELRGGEDGIHSKDDLSNKLMRFELVVIDEAYSIDAFCLNNALKLALGRLRCSQSRFLVLVDPAMRLDTKASSEEEDFVQDLIGTISSAARSSRKRSLRKWRRVIRGTRRVVAACDFYRYSKYQDFCAPLPLGEAVRTVIFETNKSVRELPALYARHVAEAVRWLRRSYEGLSLHHRLAILVPDVHFKNAMAPHLRRALEQFTVGFEFVDAAQSVDIQKQKVETLIYDVVDEALGSEWLFAVCVGLDAPLRGGSTCTEISIPEEVRWRLDISKFGSASREQLMRRALTARTRIYQAMTRAQLATVVVNHRVRFGWLEWLCHVTQETKKSFSLHGTASLAEPAYRPRLHAVAEAVTILSANIEPRLRVLRGVVSLDCWNTRANSIVFRHDPRDAPSTRLAFAPMSSRLLRVLRGHDGALLSVIAIDTEKKQPLLITCGEDATVRIWEPKTEDDDDDDTIGPLCVLEGHSGRVNSITAISKESIRLASGSRDGTVALWAPHADFPLDDVPPISRLTGHRGRVLGVVAFVLPTGESRLATTSTDRTIRIWSTTDGTISDNDVQKKPLFILDSGLVYAVVALHRQNHGVFLAGGTLQGDVHFWDVSGPGAPVRRNELSLKSHDDRVAALAVCSQVQNTQTVLSLATGSNDHTVRIWKLLDHLSPPAPTRSYRPPPKCHVLRGHSDAVVALAAAPGPNSAVPQHAPIALASASLDKTIRLWDMHSGSALRVFAQGHADHLTGLAFFHTLPTPSSFSSHDENDEPTSPIISTTRRARLASISDDATLRLWDLDND